jgi:hypothetical protein
MIFALLAAAFATLTATGAPLADDDFSRSYVVWISPDEGECIFFMTDAGEDAKQLTETLRAHYDVSKGIELLTDVDTSRRCISKAQKAVKRAGFSRFRVRRGTDADRSPGIP